MSNTLWNSCIDQLSVLLNEQDINMWLKPLEAESEGDSLTLYAPNKYVLGEVEKNFLQTIELVVKKLEPESHVSIKIGSPKTIFDIATTAQKKEEVKLTGKLNTEFTFDNFVEGESNQIAAKSALGVAKKPDGTFNPLLIYGSTGLGKSHLMHAIGNYIKSNDHKKKIIFQTAEQFFVEMLNAMAESHDKIEQLKRFYRSVDVLLIDDVQFLAGKTKTQEEFFHLFNTLLDSKSQIILTCDKYPKDVDNLESRLKSRFGAGLSVAVEPPDLETRIAILKKKASIIDFVLGDDVALFIADKVQSHVRDLEGALNSVYAMSQFSNQVATIDLAKTALKDIIDSQSRLVTIDNIQKTVATYYLIKVSDLKSKSRKAPLAKQRQVAMTIANQLTGLSLSDIGESFNRDHSTVIHAIKKIEEMKNSDPRVREDIANLVTTLTS